MWKWQSEYPQIYWTQKLRIRVDPDNNDRDARAKHENTNLKFVSERARVVNQCQHHEVVWRMLSPKNNPIYALMSRCYFNMISQLSLVVWVVGTFRLWRIVCFIVALHPANHSQGHIREVLLRQTHNTEVETGFMSHPVTVYWHRADQS